MNVLKTFLVSEPEAMPVTSLKGTITNTSVSAQKPGDSAGIPDLLNSLDMRTKPWSVSRAAFMYMCSLEQGWSGAQPPAKPDVPLKAGVLYMNKFSLSSPREKLFHTHQ